MNWIALTVEDQLVAQEELVLVVGRCMGLIDQHNSWKGRLDSRGGQVLRGEVFRQRHQRLSHREGAIRRGGCAHSHGPRGGRSRGGRRVCCADTGARVAIPRLSLRCRGGGSSTVRASPRPWPWGPTPSPWGQGSPRRRNRPSSII